MICVQNKYKTLAHNTSQKCLAAILFLNYVYQEHVDILINICLILQVVFCIV